MTRYAKASWISVEVIHVLMQSVCMERSDSSDLPFAKRVRDLFRDGDGDRKRKKRKICAALEHQLSCLYPAAVKRAPLNPALAVLRKDGIHAVTCLF